MEVNIKRNCKVFKMGFIKNLKELDRIAEISQLKISEKFKRFFNLDYKKFFQFYKMEMELVRNNYYTQFKKFKTVEKFFAHCVNEYCQTLIEENVEILDEAEVIVNKQNPRIEEVFLEDIKFNN